MCVGYADNVDIAKGKNAIKFSFTSNEVLYQQTISF